MKGLSLWAIFIVALLGLSCYVASDHLLLTAGVSAVLLFAALVLFLPVIKTFQRNQRIRHECYQFVNSYVITLSVCQSLDRAYEVASQDIEGEFKILQGKITHMNALEKTSYLISYFDMEIYAMFISLLEIYLDRGGDVLNLASELLNELARIEDSGRYVLSRSRKNLLSFGLLWAMATAVLVFIRFGLSSFFGAMKASVPYLLGIGCFFLFLLTSAYLYLRFYVSGNMKPQKRGKEKRKDVKVS